MKKKLKGVLLVLLTALAALFVFAGCSFGETLDDILTKNNLTARVTYYVNAEGAEFTPNTAKQKDLYYASGATAIDIGKVSNLGVKNDGFEFAGWYYVDKDSEGNLVTTGEYEDSEGEKHYLYALAEEVDFSKKLEEGDHWHVAARWTTASKLRVELLCDEVEAELPLDTDEYTDPAATDRELLYGKETVKSGDVVIERGYDSNDEVMDLDFDVLAFKDNAYTFVEYYLDKECTKIVEFPLKKQESDQVIYAKCIKGNWTVIRQAKSVGVTYGADRMFTYTGASYRYWLTRDLDCTGVSVKAPLNYEAEIQGNGFKLSNLTVTLSDGVTRGMFGAIKDNAKIENISFVNLKVSITVTSDIDGAYFVFSSLSDKAVITDVNLKGEFVIVTDGKFKITNFGEKGDNYTKCLYGGFEKDADYSGGFVVDGDPKDFIKKQAA